MRSPARVGLWYFRSRMYCDLEMKFLVYSFTQLVLSVCLLLGFFVCLFMEIKENS